MILIPVLWSDDNHAIAYWLPYCNVIIQLLNSRTYKTKDKKWKVVQDFR